MAALIAAGTSKFCAESWQSATTHALARAQFLRANSKKRRCVKLAVALDLWHETCIPQHANPL